MSVDPRAYSNEKLEAPDNLPFVSRRALRRVKNPLPIPKTCPYCGPRTPVFIGHHEEVYRGRSYGDWPYVYLCDNCGAYVGLHPATDIPLGTLADRKLRRARKHNKNLFNRMMDSSNMSRAESYRFLASKMGIPVEECHWGWFDVQQCKSAGDICANTIGSPERLPVK